MNATEPLTPVEITAKDVETVLKAKTAAIILTPWGTLAAVLLPYRGQDVLWTHADVQAWHQRCGRNAEATAEALSADVAWMAVAA